MNINIVRLKPLVTELRKIRELYEADLASRGVPEKQPPADMVNAMGYRSVDELAPVSEEDLPESLYTDEEMDLARSIADARRSKDD